MSAPKIQDLVNAIVFQKTVVLKFEREKKGIYEQGFNVMESDC